MIDVLIPCRNGGDQHLAALVHSIERQSVATNIDIYFNDGMPVADVRNALLARNSGEYVYYIDADDLVPSSGALERLLNGFEPGIDFVWGDFIAYLAPIDKPVNVNQSTMTKFACGSWMARRSSFPKNPWQPMAWAPHRSDWYMPVEWKGNYVPGSVFTYRVAWSEQQLTA